MSYLSANKDIKKKFDRSIASALRLRKRREGQLPCNSQLDTVLRDEKLSARMQIMIFYEHPYWDAYYVVVTCAVKIIKMCGGGNNTARP
jgi:hypothetical protein